MLSVIKFLDSSPTMEEVAQKIESLRDDIRTLENYRNARLLIISRLPPEVLSLIFEYAALSKQDSPQYYSSTGRPYRQWLPVTQVCRLWRNIALNNPRMWGCIYDHTPKKFAELLLERTKSAPLYIRSYGMYTKPETVELLLDRTNRLKEIDMTRCTPEWLECITKSQTPILERLRIRLSQPQTTATQFKPDVGPGKVSHLRHLSLTNCVFDIGAPSFSGLRTLKIHYSSTDAPTSGLLPVIDVLLALVGMTQLTYLELNNVLFGSDEIPVDVFAVLPFLASMRIETLNISGLKIVTRLSCPSIQSIDAVCHRQAAPDALAPVASAIYAMIPISTPWKTVVYLTPSTSACSAVVRIWPTGVRSGEAPFHISVSGRPDFQTDRVLCSLLPTTEPFILDFRHIGSHREDLAINLVALQPLLQSLENVQELHVGHFNDILAVLSDTPEKVKKTQPPSGPLSLPSLKHIVWHTRGQMKSMKRKLSKFKQRLASRKSMNASVEILDVRADSYTQMSEEDLEPFRKCVETVKFRKAN